jgi:hypothetical protein
MSEQIDYQILLQEIAKTAKEAAAAAKSQQHDDLFRLLRYFGRDQNPGRNHGGAVVGNRTGRI